MSAASLPQRVRRAPRLELVRTEHDLDRLSTELFPEELRLAVEAAAEFEVRHRADRTRLGYQYAWESFERWCDGYGLVALPAHPKVIAAYIGHLATTGGRSTAEGDAEGRKASTVIQHVTAIRAIHKDNGSADPTADPYVQRVLRGLKRTKGSRRIRREPMTLHRLFTVIDAIDDRRLLALVDHVVIAADAHRIGNRRSLGAAYLARLDWTDVRMTDGGIELARSGGEQGDWIKVAEYGGPLCLAGAIRALGSALAERAAAEQSRRGSASADGAWKKMSTEARLPASGPLLPKLDRNGQLQAGRASRHALATRLSRSAHAVGVECGRQARPIWTDSQRAAAVRHVQTVHLADIRDRALLLLGFALAARRSNLSLLAVGEISNRPEGLVVHFRRSKTDQEGLGRDLAVPRKGGRYCPVAAWERWLDALTSDLGAVPEPAYPAFPALNRSGTRVAGPRLVFETRAGKVVRDEAGCPVVAHLEGVCGDEINEIVKRRAKAAGLQFDPETGVRLRWGAHSLRRGWMTEAARQGISLEQMMEHSGHVTVAVALEYIAEAKKFDPRHSAAMRLSFHLDQTTPKPSASVDHQRS